MNLCCSSNCFCTYESAAGLSFVKGKFVFNVGTFKLFCCRVYKSEAVLLSVGVKL